MDSKSTQQELQQQFNDVVSRLESKQFFQSDWDTAFFILFFVFFGTVLLLILLVLIRCCCCCCCDGEKPHKKVGIENMGLEP
uniref:Si:ch1073-443f11.2 n=1 Tax=Nothobranchius pienaari TaxID=704102 RepID=A0A1A8MDC7_9TELE